MARRLRRLPARRGRGIAARGGGEIATPQATGAGDGPSPLVLAWRTAHGLIALGLLAAIACVWWAALTGRRGPALRLAVGSLVAEGAVVALNRGDCPLGPLGERIGDPVPLFELVLPPRAARLAVPLLGGIAGAGILLLAARRKRPGLRA
ncbi:MAG: hypothetical protein EDQ89_03280 [Acidobacteria bacterium]|nr:MAG: hypothetical protein EDQ89_03280 [Acidobacteriota bacterium]GIK78031.1 MAG: hypothetical protein BroJett022_17210 [Actinomycetes bacterium]